MSAREKAPTSFAAKLKQFAELLALLRQLDRRRRDRDEQGGGEEKAGQHASGR